MSATPDPVGEIVAAREQARAAGDPLVDACILATVDADGTPGVRPLILRDVGPQGLGLLVSASSRKWEPLGAARYECLLLWLSVGRQYRVRGHLAPMPDDLVEGYWQRKAHASQLLDVYYDAVQPQSTAVASRAVFLDGIDALRRRHPTPAATPRPALLRGVYLVPSRVEAWHRSPDRLHDRHLYTRDDAGWREQILIP